jgi:hypothetical protein
MKHTITELVKGTDAFFKKLRQGVAYYGITISEKEKFYVYVFTVDLSDLGEATLNSSEKSILLMRYIRKSIEDGTITCQEFDY